MNFLLSSIEPLLAKTFDAIVIVLLHTDRLKNYENVVILVKWNTETQ